MNLNEKKVCTRVMCQIYFISISLMCTVFVFVSSVTLQSVCISEYISWYEYFFFIILVNQSYATVFFIMLVFSCVLVENIGEANIFVYICFNFLRCSLWREGYYKNRSFFFFFFIIIFLIKQNYFYNSLICPQRL